MKSLLIQRNFDIVTKPKLIKYRTVPIAIDQQSTSSPSLPDTDTNLIQSNNNNKQYLFVSETTLESFVRRLSWTIDGAYLIVPAATWTKPVIIHHEYMTSTSSTLNSSPTTSPSSGVVTNPTATTYATLIYQRHRFDEPWKVLGGLEKVRLIRLLSYFYSF